MAMYSSTGSIDDIDFNSLELMCLYIGEYRCFSDTGINLNAKYNFVFQRNEGADAEWPIVHVSFNNDHVDLFQEYGVNLKVICGINGVGKTTILQLLRHNHHAPDDRYFVLFKDKDDKFLCTKNIHLLNEGKKVSLVSEMSDVNLSTLTSSLIERKSEEFGILLNIASSYSANKELFDFDTAPLFTHFNIDIFSKRDKREEIERVLADDFGIRDDLYLWSLWQDHPLIYCFLHFCQDSTFVVIRREMKKDVGCINELVALFAEGEWKVDYKTLNKEVRAVLFKQVPSAVRKTPAKSPEEIRESMALVMEQPQKDYKPRLYAFSKFETVQRQWRELEKQVYEFFSTTLADNCHINPSIFEGLFYFRPVRLFVNGSVRSLDDLSHGESFSVMTKYALLPRMAQTDGVWFDDDEADKHLHPEWKRKFLCSHLEAIRETRTLLANHNPKEDYNGKIYSVILTTHSPFLLSDVPGDHVVYLEPSVDRTACGLPKTLVRSGELQNSFCGNIGEMFYSNFFMEETIGEFAKQKIEKALKELDGDVSPKRFERIESLFGMVGDSLLKSLLDEKLEQAKVSNEKD